MRYFFIFFIKTIDLELTPSDNLYMMMKSYIVPVEGVMLNMTIAEVSKKYNLTQDTIRYYEKEGLIPTIPRTESGIRNFDEESCNWIEFIKCMRNAGLEIEVLKEYVELFKQGKSTVSKRKELLERQKDKLLKKQKDINETLERLNYKIKLYNEIEAGVRKDFMEKP